MKCKQSNSVAVLRLMCEWYDYMNANLIRKKWSVMSFDMWYSRFFHLASQSDTLG